jgi:hypothetical protein
MCSLKRLMLPALLGLAACGGPPRLTNLEPAQQMARAQTAAPASLYAGWRVYQQHCASCHGDKADGGSGGANLLLRMQSLGPQRFVEVVLRRYDQTLGVQAGDAPSREALVGALVERRAPVLVMPAWQGDPVVQAHVMDLYAYLAARSENRLPAGRPSL